MALGAADEDVAEELHFDFLEAGATAAFALALRGIETERAGAEAALAGEFGLGEEFAKVVECTDVNGGVGARRLGESGLIHENDAARVSQPVILGRLRVEG